jgi:hypothetical protein
MGNRKGRPNLTEPQKTRIVSARLQGRTAKQIATEIGCAPGTVENQLSRADTRHLLASLRAEHHHKIRGAFGRFVDRLTARLEDPKARDWLACGDRLLRILELGDRLAPAEEPKPETEGQYTLEELLVSFHQAKLAREANADERR